jgi:hypothetical protein
MAYVASHALQLFPPHPPLLQDAHEVASLRDINVLTAAIAGPPAESHGIIAPSFRPLLVYATRSESDVSVVARSWMP